MMNISTIKYKRIFIFVVGVLMYMAAVLPSLIYRHGFFYYFGDYNYQTITFYTMAHRAVREGYFLWNPLIEYGASMAGSMSFYLWFSPFFWITVPFPADWMPQMLVGIMALRYGVAMITSFTWLRSQTRTDRGALIGSILYAFSGYSAVNIVFAHMIDVVAFFPLYLLTFDRLMERRKWIGFVFMTAFMSVLNYFFFFGQVVFFLLYYLIRYYTYRPRELRTALSERKEAAKTEARLTAKSALFSVRVKKTGLSEDEKVFESSRKKQNRVLFFSALLYGALGIGISAFFLLQALSGMAGNDRLGKILKGDAFLMYANSSTYWAILKSVFFVPELMGRQSLFANSEFAWSSVSLYLPLLSVAGVIAYNKSRKNKWHDWKIRLFLANIILILIPGLNSLFSALNIQFYARWYYMFILILSLMTAQALEECEMRDIRLGAKIVLYFTFGFLVFSFLPGQKYALFGGWISMPENANLYVPVVGATLVSALTLCYFAYGDRKGDVRQRMLGNETILLIAMLAIITTGAVAFDGCLVYSNEDAHNYKTQAIENRPNIDMTAFSRIETDDSMINWNLLWGWPSDEVFCSTSSPSSYEIFNNIFNGRNTTTNVYYSYPGFRAITSTRYYLENQNAPEELSGFAAMMAEEVSHRQQQIEAKNNVSSSIKETSIDYGLDSEIPLFFTEVGESNGMVIYEADNFIPIGFTFDNYMSRDDWLSLKEKAIDTGNFKYYFIADRLLTQNIILTDEQIERYGRLLVADTESHEMAMTEEEFSDACSARAATSCTAFSYDPTGYQATITLNKENLVFFSISYDKGWKAFVDGVETQVEDVDFGFIAVDVPAGNHEIQLIWTPCYWQIGAIVSGLAILVTVGLVFWEKKTFKERTSAEQGAENANNKCTGDGSLCTGTTR